MLPESSFNVPTQPHFSVEQDRYLEDILLPAPGRDPDPISIVRYYYRFRHLLISFVVNDLKSRYVGSFIGFFWTVLDPILELLIYTFVFSVILQVRFDEQGDTVQYALFLFCGMVAWFNVQESLSRATPVLEESAHLIKKMNFPALILPLHVVLSGTLNQVIRTAVLLSALEITGYGLSYHILLLPLVMGLQVMLLLGLAMILATIHVFFKDIGHIVKVGLMVWMFITPIFYPPSIFPERFKVVLVLNPMSHLIGIYQELLLNHRMPHEGSVIILATFTLFSFIIGNLFFARYQGQFAELV